MFFDVCVQEITTATETMYLCTEIDQIFVTREIFVTVQSLRLKFAQCFKGSMFLHLKMEQGKGRTYSDGPVRNS
jgi:hypothetical protein